MGELESEMENLSKVKKGKIANMRNGKVRNGKNGKVKNMRKVRYGGDGI